MNMKKEEKKHEKNNSCEEDREEEIPFVELAEVNEEKQRGFSELMQIVESRGFIKGRSL